VDRLDERRGDGLLYGHRADEGALPLLEPQRWKLSAPRSSAATASLL
jgi:hypothetical protein